jgi:hypothetical protein
LPEAEFLEKRSKLNKQANERNRKIKIKVLEYYSNGELKCANPYHIHNEVIINPTLLTIDHINGDGYKEKGKHGRRIGGSAFYRKLLRQNFPDGFQVLCWNCQAYKREFNQEYGEKRYKYKSKIKSED